MQRKIVARLCGTGLIAISLANGRFAIAQNSLAPPVRRLNDSSRTSIHDDSGASSIPELETLTRDLRSQKKQIVAANLSLTGTEAEKFWPVYDRYAADTAKIYDVKMALVEEYLENLNTMDGDAAESNIRRRAAAEQELMALRIKYVPEFRKVISGKQAALFFQIEWRLDSIINLQLAQVPQVDP